MIEAKWLAADERFEDNIQRMQHLPELVEILDGIFIQFSSSRWLECLERAGVPAGPVLDIAGMHADPQALARGMVTTAPHSRLGEIPTLGHPVHYSDTPTEIVRGAPLYGQHTREVLAENGFSEERIDALQAEGVVVIAA